MPSADCGEDLFFNNDGSELYLFDYQSEQNTALVIVDTTANTVSNTMELNMVVQRIVAQSPDSTTIAAITIEPGVDINDVESANYYLTFIDTESRTSENIYMGEGIGIYSEDFVTNNDETYLYLFLPRLESNADNDESDAEELLFRADLKSKTLESLGVLTVGDTFIGETSDGTGLLLVENNRMRSTGFFDERIGTLTLANYDDPTNQNLWRTLTDSLRYTYPVMSGDGQSLYMYDLEVETPADQTDESGYTLYPQIVRQYDTDSGEVIATLTLPDLANGQQDYLNSDDGSILVISDTYKDPSTVTVINLNDMEIVDNYEISCSKDLFAISPTNRLLYTEGHDTCLEVINIETGSIVAIMNPAPLGTLAHVYARTVAIAPDASFGYFNGVDNFSDNEVRLFRFETDERITALEAASQWVERNLNPTYLAVGGVVLVVAVAGGVIAAVAHRRKKAASPAKNGNLPSGNGGLPNGYAQ